MTIRTNSSSAPGIVSGPDFFQAFAGQARQDISLPHRIQIRPQEAPGFGSSRHPKPQFVNNSFFAISK